MSFRLFVLLSLYADSHAADILFAVCFCVLVFVCPQDIL